MAKLRLCILLGIGLLATGTALRSACAVEAVPEPATWADTSSALRWGVGQGSLTRRYRRDPRLPFQRVPKSVRAPWAPAAAGRAPSSAQAIAGTPTADPNLWGADGNVLDVARSGNTLYIAGSFRSVGENTGGLVPVDARTGELLRPFPKVAGTVYVILPDGSGGWYIGGEFTAVGGKPRSCLAQIRADGSVTDWNPSVTGSPGYIDPPAVMALALHDNRLFVGGAFREIGGRPHENFGCVGAQTGAVLDWILDITPEGYVAALLVDRDLVFVAGGFSSIAGQPRSSLAALNAASGEVLPWRADVFGGAYALQARDDTLYVGGDYIGIAGVERHMLAALDITTAQLLPFDARVSGLRLDYFPDPEVSALALVGDTLYAAGNFTHIGGQARASLAALNTSTGALIPWTPDSLGPRYDGFPPPLVETLAVDEDGVYFGGWFNTVGGVNHSGVAALSRETGRVMAWDPKSGSVVQALTLRGGAVFLGGELSFVGGWQHRAGLAAIDLTTGTVKPWNPNPDGSICTAIAVSGARVFVSGDFANIGGAPQPRRYFAALDTVNGEVLGWDPGANEIANVFLLAGDTLYAGGEFTKIGGQTRSYLAALDATTGEVLPWNPSASWPVYALARSINTIYVGGLFSWMGGQSRRGIAAVDATTGAVTPWNPDTDNSTVDVVLVSGNTVYVGGGFNSIGGQARNAIAALDATTGEATPWYPQPSGWGAPTRVRGFALVGGKLFVGGDFGSIGGQPRICLAAVDTSSGLATDWDPSLNGLVWSLTTCGNTIYAGGGFTRAGGLPAVGLAAFDVPLDPAPEPLTFALGASMPNPCRSIAVIPFSLPEAAAVTLSIFDLQGRKVGAPLDQTVLLAGSHLVSVDVGQWSAGVYFCRLAVGSRSATRKLVVVP